ncbi:MAG: phosphate transport system permease protein [Psychrosphaera sp.]|jgi:phosphate transport system permease protein|uniref:ABC transporter permease subunit n=1 Tax=Psychrosphaera sp. F3M07 TaxID=2841560 RepID=UPI0020907183|nr:ABC transporter permease subunit [Psychrosphaera sp. F3M07]
MSRTSDNALKTESTRLIKDKVAKYGVTVGGVMVLCALLLIFFYLLYIVKPVFNAPHIEPISEITELTKNYVSVSVEEQNEIAFALTKQGEIDFYSLSGEDAGQLVLTETIPSYNRVTAFNAAAPQQGLFGYINQQSELMIVKPTVKISFPNDKRKLMPYMSFPFGEAAMPLEVDNLFTIDQFSFATEEQSIGLVHQHTDSKVYFTKLEGEEDMFSDEIVWTKNSTELTQVNGKIISTFVSPGLSRVFVVTKTQLYVFDTMDAEEVELLYTVNLVAKSKSGVTITAANLLAGANSMIIGFSNGVLEQWFETNSDEGRDFVKVRQFNMTGEAQGSAIDAIYPEFYRRTFLASTNTGHINLFHTTSEAELWQGQIAQGKINTLSFSPRSNAVISISNNTLDISKVDNEHPEVTWSGLWQEVWYEGYPKADYVWQSSSASDDFESKFSLVPISFGTLKAAMYAMLFAVPIGLSAAIYTAYFMAPNVRKIVKPTVEIMEALPTVILGFLAGLWLAPVIEQHLPGVVLLLILLPIAILLTAFAWHNLPQKIKNMVPQGWDSIILLPIVVLVSYASFSLSPLVELWLFDGNTRLYITNELGINFDQRNSLIVGIAMGFAVIPTIFSIAEDAVFSVPKTLSNGSLALGATQWQTLVKVVLLTASPGIFSAVMMGLGRAVGETMIVLMATGNTPIMDWSIFEGMRTLSANIAVEMPESEVGSSHYRILFLAAFVLFIFTFVVNTIAEFVRQRLREKYSSL